MFENIRNFLFSILVCGLVGCDDSNSQNNSGVTSAHAVGGDTDTMDDCKYRLDQTAKKYNVTYTVEIDERDYFSGHIVKNGIETDLILICRKKDDYYTAMFEVPN